MLFEKAGALNKMWLFVAVGRWAEKIERHLGSQKERVVAVANYEAQTSLSLFFMQDGNLVRYCRLLLSYERFAEEDGEIIRDGVAWCQEGRLPAHSRPMDHLPSKEESAYKKYR